MVVGDHIEEQEGAEELKREQCDADATTTWRQQRREVGLM